MTAYQMRAARDLQTRSSLPAKEEGGDRMATEVIIPEDLWAEDWEMGAMLEWLVPDGSDVRHGQAIAEVLVDKVTLELESPATGTLRIRAAANGIFRRGERVAQIL